MLKYLSNSKNQINPNNKNIYKAKFEDYLLLCQSKETLKIFKSEDELNSYYDQVKKTYKIFPIDLIEKKSPTNLIKIGDYLITNSLLQILFKNELGIKNKTNHWTLTPIGYNIELIFKTEIELKSWVESIKQINNNTNKKIRKPKISNKKKIGATIKKKKKKITIQGNLHKRPPIDMDWWREQE